MKILSRLCHSLLFLKGKQGIYLSVGSSMSGFVNNAMGAVSSAVTSKGLEMPEHTVVEKHETYEERNYPKSMWVSTKIVSMQHREASRKGFWKLFNYIQGKNERKQKIDMTAPVTVQVQPGAGPNCESTFIVSFYLGKDHWENPPIPSEKDVYIDTWQPMSVYVRTFGGFSDDEKWINEGKALAESMKEGSKFKQDFYITAGYDSPFKLFNRRNEVLFVKESESETIKS